MKREIVELDDLLLIDAKIVAKQQEKTLDEVIDAALRQYVEANRQPNRLPFAGMINVPWPSSAPEDLDQELIDGLDPREGWSPDRRSPDESRARG